MAAYDGRLIRHQIWPRRTADSPRQSAVHDGGRAGQRRPERGEEAARLSHLGEAVDLALERFDDGAARLVQQIPDPAQAGDGRKAQPPAPLPRPPDAPAAE